MVGPGVKEFEGEFALEVGLGQEITIVVLYAAGDELQREAGHELDRGQREEVLILRFQLAEVFIGLEEFY